jgi:hypothetical protein
MSAQARLSLVKGQSVGARCPSFGTRLEGFKSHVAAWITTCADYYEAAARYEQLSKLSDAELQQRGLSRTTLARHVCTHAVNRGELS